MREKVSSAATEYVCVRVCEGLQSNLCRTECRQNNISELPSLWSPTPPLSRTKCLSFATGNVHNYMWSLQYWGLNHTGLQNKTLPFQLQLWSTNFITEANKNINQTNNASLRNSHIRWLNYNSRRCSCSGSTHSFWNHFNYFVFIMRFSLQVVVIALLW